MGYPWCLTLKNGWVRVGKEASQFPGSGVERGLENFEDFSKVKIGRLPCQGREVLKNRGLSGKTQGEKVTDGKAQEQLLFPFCPHDLSVGKIHLRGWNWLPKHKKVPPCFE